MGDWLVMERIVASNKKRPPDYSCLDGVQVWLTEGARSRNHKKVHFSRLPL
jgi:hypothetical protein